MPTISRFVIWERPPDFSEINPALASLLCETGIESLDLVHGQEPSHLGRNAPEIKHLLRGAMKGQSIWGHDLEMHICRSHRFIWG
jgi:hypothetical protein